MAAAFAVFSILFFGSVSAVCFWIYKQALHNNGCIIDLASNLRASSPLFLDIKTNEVIYPKKSNGYITFTNGQQVRIHCFGGNITRFDVTTNHQTETITCYERLNFTESSNKTRFSYTHVNCSKDPEPTIFTSDNGQAAIGYKKPGSDLRVMYLRHDESLATTVWAHSRIPSVIGTSKIQDYKTPAFKKGPFFNNVNITKVYPRKEQVKIFTIIFNNDTSLVEYYLPESPKPNYLVRGHLVARADEFYYPQQYSTYYYINVLPMWNSINNGNWVVVESSVRKIANKVGNLEVWTGGIGTLKLNNREIFLTRDINNSSKWLVPAPRLLFKLALHRKNKQCMAFITQNNPYLNKNVSKICREYQECRKKFSKFDRFYEGWTYCCLCQNFLKNKEVKELHLPVDFQKGSALPLS